jgi:hypothetical protein
LLTLRPTPSNLGGPIFSVGVISLSWLVPNLERQELALSPLHDLALPRSHDDDMHALGSVEISGVCSDDIHLPAE